MSTSAMPVESPRRSAWAIAKTVVTVWIALEVVVLTGLYGWQKLVPKRRGYEFNAATLQFVDHAQTNAPLDACDVGSLEFRDSQGRTADLRSFRGKQNVVLVVTRGNTSGGGTGAYYRSICLYCATHTSRLIANYQAFRAQDAEVVVIFPLRLASDGGTVDDFREALRRDGGTGEPPFPLLVDVELRAVDQLGIRADLSKPATYILDKQGQVRFAYVGANIADRPSVAAMLEQLAQINADNK